jgi:KaiC
VLVELSGYCRTIGLGSACRSTRMTCADLVPKRIRRWSHLAADAGRIHQHQQKVVLRMTAHPKMFKAATGIDGLDAIAEGGLPAGRPTLLCGAAGCGKTLFGVTFLVEGALRFDLRSCLCPRALRGDSGGRHRGSGIKSHPRHMRARYRRGLEALATVGRRISGSRCGGRTLILAGTTIGVRFCAVGRSTVFRA